MRYRAALLMIGVALTVCAEGTDSGAGHDVPACAEYGEYFHWIGRANAETQLWGVAVNETHAFVAARSSGVMVYDLTEPGTPEHVATLPCGEDALYVGLYGDVLLVDNVREDPDRPGWYSVDTYVVDISSPASPFVIISLELTTIQPAAVIADHLYLRSTTGLKVIDLTNRQAPRVLASDAIEERVEDLLALDGRLFALTPTRLCVLDLRDPDVPKLDSALTIPLPLTNLESFGGRLYLAASAELLEIDPSGPGAPIVSARFLISDALPGCSPRQLLAGDGLLFLACRDLDPIPEFSFRIQVMDIATPGDLRPMGTFPVYENPQAWTFRSPYLYGIDEPGIFAADVSDPMAPAIVLWTTDRLRSANAAFNESHLFTTGSGQMSVYALGTAPNVPPLARVETPGAAWSLALAGQHAYVAELNFGVQVVCLGADGSGTIVGSLPVPGGTRSLFVEGSHLHIGDRQYGLLVADVREPASPSIVASVPLVDGANIVTGAADLLAVATRGRELILFDVSVPEAPVRVGDWTAPGTIQGLCVAGELAYLTSAYQLLIVDLQVPGSISPLSSLELPGYGEGLTVADGFAYVGLSQAAVAIVDVGSPTEPQIVAIQGTPTACYDLLVQGNLAYVAGGRSGVQIIDVAHPSTPRLIGRAGYLEPSSDFGLRFVRKVVVTDGRLYVADYFGLQILPQQCIELTEVIEVAIDLRPGSDTDPINCRSRGVLPVAILTTPAFDARQVDHETVVFGPGEAHEAHSGRAGLRRHEEDVDGDGDVDLLFHFRVQEARVDCSEEWVELTGWTYDGRQIHGVASFRSIPPARPTPAKLLRLQASPNPFNPLTAISFDLPMQTAVSLWIYDMSGRLIRTLLDREIVAEGRHDAVWNGRDNTGKQVAAGVYFCRLEAGELRETKKMVLVR